MNVSKDAWLLKMDHAYYKAIDNLGRYKFDRFGYYAARWVVLNKLGRDLGILDKKERNPFNLLVHTARGAHTFTARHPLPSKQFLNNK